MLKTSILLLMRMMQAHFQKPVILLLDEYDVPLAKASANGYYPQMLELMKSLMSTALKDNSTLRFASITGCLKIAKESIFTGTNNFVSDTISSSSLDEYLDLPRLTWKSFFWMLICLIGIRKSRRGMTAITSVLRMSTVRGM